MRSGRCPKCGSYDVRVGAREFTHLGQRRNTLLGSATVLDVAAHITVYVCLYCAYSEDYIEDPQALQEIAKKWPGVQPPPAPPPNPGG
jgi:hypothetical protein